MDNFEELKRKVHENPKSSLFVPLAEEYRKRDELDEAINVLRAGLERQPGYMTAHVALARIYLSKGMNTEAVEELEQVIAVAPDNLYAHRKLAETYCLLGRHDEAAGQFRVILELHPEDEAAQEGLSKLLSGDVCDASAEGAPEGASDDLDSTMVMKRRPSSRQVEEASEKTVVMQAPAFEEESATDDLDGTMVMKKRPSPRQVEEASEKTVVMQAPVFDAETEEEKTMVMQAPIFDAEPDAPEKTVVMQAPVFDAGESEEVRGVSVDGGDFETLASTPLVEEPADEFIDDSAEDEIEVFGGIDEYEADDADMGGLEYEPDGVYADDDSEVMERDDEAGVDIGFDATYTNMNALGEAFESHPGDADIIRASEQAGRAILDEGHEEEYSGESLIANKVPDMEVQQAPGLETFEQQDEGSSEDIVYEDETTLMQPPFEAADETVVMQTPFEAEEATPAYEAESADETLIMQAPFEAAEADSVYEAGTADETVIMQAPFEESPATPVESMEVAADENQTISIAPDAAQPEEETLSYPSMTEALVADEVPAVEGILAEPGSINEEDLAAEPDHLINDPMSGLGAGGTHLDEDFKDSLELAESHITCGEYSLAMNIYKDLSKKYPEQGIIKMKMEELKMLLKVMGQGDMVYEQKIESFLAAIMRRRDELRKTA